METEEKIKKLQAELQLGENSTMIEDFDAEKHLKELHNKYLKK